MAQFTNMSWMSGVGSDVSGESSDVSGEVGYVCGESIDVREEDSDERSLIVVTSIMFLLVKDSCGSLYSVYFRRTLSMSVLAY